ncbi:MAG: hypothetical protein QX196_14000 [Methylococcaceae bacterium]
MNLLVNRKLMIQFVLIGIVILFYDVMLHAMFSIVHIAFEWLELTLDHIIEHIFHTDRQQSQIIVFYLLWLIAFYGLYRICRALPGIYNRLKEQLFAICLQCKSYLIEYWRDQSSVQKIKWLTFFIVGLSCLVFITFS